MIRGTSRFKALARLDLVEAGTWYEEERRGLSVLFLDEVAAVEARLLDNPLQFPAIGSGLRRALVHGFPYSVYFTVTDQLVEVEAVLHQHRGPNALRSRLEGDG